MTQIEFKGFEGIRLVADVTGPEDAPSVVLLHGGGQTRKVWTEAAAALIEAGRHVINLDLRGHGASDWPGAGRYGFEAYVEDLRAVLGQLGSRPVVVAASFAGWVAVAALAGEGAHLAAGLVLVDAPPRLDPAVAKTVSDQLRAHALSRGGEAHWDRQFLDGVDSDAVLERLNAAAPNLNLPTLFVRGAASRVTGQAEAEAFVSRLPNAEFVEVEEAGHLVASERAEVFNALLVDFLERKAPRAPPEFRTGSDARTLRDALGCFATGVTIVTTYTGEGKPVGLTANSFTSVSLDPALLLVCIAKTAATLPFFESSPRFCVNVLHIGQQPTSNRFTRKDVDRFETIPWEDGEFHVPVLTGSLANFECERDAVHEGGDHILLVGKVLRAQFEPRRDPLLYFKGRYRRLHLG